MAATTSFQAQLNRPPLHLEGNLVLHKPAKFGVPQSKRGFFVLLKTVLQQYKTETMYHKGQKPIKQFEIRLEEVCGITESLIPNKHYKNCSFSLTMNNGVEHTFSAESTQAMKMWVNGLRLAKEFYAQYYKRERAQQKSQQSMTPCRDTTISYTSGKKEGTEMDVALNSHKPGQDSELARVQVTTWDGVTRRVVVPLVFDVEELLSALSGKIQKCAACPTCKLQRTSMEIWTVDERGIGRKLDREGGTLDVFKLGRHFYVLVHNYKLLIVHFEDNTFQVLPGFVSLKAKEVPYLPIFAAKLSSLGCTNVGLYLVNDQGTSIRFHPEEEPLRYSFSERLVLKSRVLGIAAPISRTRTAIQRERFQKAQQNRKNQNALKRVEQEKCKQHSNFPGRIFNKKAFDPPRNGVVSPLAFDRQTNDHCTTKASSSECEEISLSSTNVSALTLLCDPEDEKRSTEFFDTIIPQADTNDTVIVDDRIVSNGLSADCDDSGIAELQSQENEEIVESSSSESSIESFSPSFPSVSSEPTKDEYMHESDKGTVPGEGDGSINCGDLHKEDGAWEAARDGDGSSSLTSPQSRPSLSTSSSSAAVSEDNFGRSDDESPGRMSDSSISAERGDDILAEEPCEMPESSECKERSVVDFHSCGYTIVGSPRVLHLVVRVCASHKQNEEEVGESNKFSSICLSGWHLKYERGSWSVVDKGRSSIFHSDLADVVKIKLTETILALFNEEDKVWTVVENQKVVKEDSIQLSQIERPIVNCDLNTLEETLDDVNLLWPKMNVGTIELPEEHPIAGEAISTNTNWEQSPEERLRSSIQDIFIHMSAYCDSPKSALSDSKHDGLFEIVRKPLCNALWDLLSVGLRKKTFFRNQTVWNVVNSMKDVSGNVSRTVEWVNSKYACRLDEREKFQVFVCECLNIGRGTLHLWLNCLFMEKQRLTEYYSQEGIMFQRSSEDLERIVMSLSRISSLPFELQSESGIKMRRDMNEPAFSFE